MQKQIARPWGKFFALFVISTLLICFAMFTTVTHALTTTPTTLNFQGRLLDSAGAPVADGLYNMKFALYTVSTGGSSVWNETRENNGTDYRVQVTNGLFTTKLGQASALSASLFASGNLYFDITQATPATATCSTTGCATWESPMTPRHQLSTSAYAFNSETLDGLDSTAFAQLGTTNTFTSTNTIQTTSTNAFKVQNASSLAVLTADTSGNALQVGSSTTDANAILLGLDSYNNGTDPTGFNGAIYYNTSLNKFRCYQNAAWTDCIGSGSGASLSANNTWTGTNLFSVTNASALKVQNASAVNLLTVDTSGNQIVLGASDTTGVLLVLDTKTSAGDPTGVDGAMYYNSNLAQYRCYRDGDWEPCGTKPIDRSWEINDDFLGGAVAVGTGIGNANWTHVTISTACTLTYNNNAAPAPSADRPGILKMTTNATAAANTGCRVYQGTSTGGTLALAAGQIIKAAVAPGITTSGAILLRVGADASTVTSNAQPTTSGVWWEADPATNANWRYCYSTGAAATCANSTVALAATTMARLEIKITATGAGTSSAVFTVNGTQYTVTGVTINTATLVRPNIMCTTGGTSSASTPCYVDYFQMRGDASAAR